MSETATPPTKKATRAGNYFISNYPPFSFWSSDQEEEVRSAYDSAPIPGTPLGLYHHIPFCRRRCHFCYFRVYTDKSSYDEVPGFSLWGGMWGNSGRIQPLDGNRVPKKQPRYVEDNSDIPF